MAKNARLTIDHWRGVLANDSDAEDQALKVVFASKSAKGKLVLHADGSFVFTPNKNFVGTATFTYRDFDGDDHANLAAISFVVGGTKAIALRMAQHLAAIQHDRGAETLDSVDNSPAPAHHGADVASLIGQHDHGTFDLMFH